MRYFCLAFLWSAAGLFTAAAGAPVQFVVSSRNYQVEGASGVHLYLFAADGKLEKQLTHDTKGDIDPCFSPDGKSISFLRVGNVEAASQEADRYRLDLATGKLTKLASDQALFQGTLTPLEFNDLIWGPEDTTLTSIEAPDRSATLYRRDAHWPFVYSLKLSSETRPLPLSSFPGYVPDSEGDGDTLLAEAGNPFFVAPENFCIIFFERHSSCLWVCDVRHRRCYETNPDGSTGGSVAVEGEPGFYVIHGSLISLRDEKNLTVLCSPIEFWDAHFHRIRLGPSSSASYGAAAFYGPGRTFVVPNFKMGS